MVEELTLRPAQLADFAFCQRTYLEPASVLAISSSPRARTRGGVLLDVSGAAHRATPSAAPARIAFILALVESFRKAVYTAPG